jgi:hypothetical protein
MGALRELLAGLAAEVADETEECFLQVGRKAEIG